MIVWIIGIIVALVAIVYCMVSWYRIVQTGQAHIVITPTEKFVASPDESLDVKGLAKDGEQISIKKTYFAIPSSIPFFGRVARIIDLTIMEINEEQETFDRGQARFKVQTSLKYRVDNIGVFANTVSSIEELNNQLVDIVKSTVRAVTIGFDINEARAHKQQIDEKIREEIADDLAGFGLKLINFQLVDFSDIEGGHVIENISLQREVYIESQTKQANATNIQLARVREADADKVSREKEIARDKFVGEQEQMRKQAIAIEEAKARQKEMEVIRIQELARQEIDKQKAIILAEQQVETEKRIKERKVLEGQGDQLRAESQAKGKASEVLEGLLAEAKGKTELRKALEGYNESTLKALTAEKIIDKDKAVGIETAKALSQADLRVFSGGDSTGFDLGKLLSSVAVSDSNTAQALLNKVARPNDFGFQELPKTEAVKKNRTGAK